MKSTHTSQIRHAQREATLLREFSSLFIKLALDETSLQNLFISRVILSPNRSVCNVFFHSTQGETGFKESFSTLILYKPSLRHALAKSLNSRYTPNLVFKYDDKVEKQHRIDSLINSISGEDSSS